MGSLAAALIASLPERVAPTQTLRIPVLLNRAKSFWTEALLFESFKDSLGLPILSLNSTTALWPPSAGGWLLIEVHDLNYPSRDEEDRPGHLSLRVRIWRATAELGVLEQRLSRAMPSASRRALLQIGLERHSLPALLASALMSEEEGALDGAFLLPPCRSESLLSLPGRVGHEQAQNWILGTLVPGFIPHPSSAVVIQGPPNILVVVRVFKNEGAPTTLRLLFRAEEEPSQSVLELLKHRVVLALRNLGEQHLAQLIGRNPHLRLGPSDIALLEPEEEPAGVVQEEEPRAFSEWVLPVAPGPRVGTLSWSRTLSSTLGALGLVVLTTDEEASSVPSKADLHLLWHSAPPALGAPAPSLRIGALGAALGSGLIAMRLRLPSAELSFSGVLRVRVQVWARGRVASPGRLAPLAEALRRAFALTEPECALEDTLSTEDDDKEGDPRSPEDEAQLFLKIQPALEALAAQAAPSLREWRVPLRVPLWVLPALLTELTLRVGRLLPGPGALFDAHGRPCTPDALPAVTGSAHFAVVQRQVRPAALVRLVVAAHELRAQAWRCVPSLQERFGAILQQAAATVGQHGQLLGALLRPKLGLAPSPSTRLTLSALRSRLQGQEAPPSSSGETVDSVLRVAPPRPPPPLSSAPLAHALAQHAQPLLRCQSRLLGRARQQRLVGALFAHWARQEGGMGGGLLLAPEHLRALLRSTRPVRLARAQILAPPAPGDVPATEERIQLGEAAIERVVASLTQLRPVALEEKTPGERWLQQTHTEGVILVRLSAHADVLALDLFLLPLLPPPPSSPLTAATAPLARLDLSTLIRALLESVLRLALQGTSSPLLGSLLSSLSLPPSPLLSVPVPLPGPADVAPLFAFITEHAAELSVRALDKSTLLLSAEQSDDGGLVRLVAGDQALTLFLLRPREPSASLRLTTLVPLLSRAKGLFLRTTLHERLLDPLKAPLTGPELVQLLGLVELRSALSVDPALSRLGRLEVGLGLVSALLTHLERRFYPRTRLFRLDDATHLLLLPPDPVPIFLHLLLDVRRPLLQVQVGRLRPAPESEAALLQTLVNSLAVWAALPSH